MNFANLPVARIALNDMPFYHQSGARNGCTYIYCGEVKPSGNGRNAYVEERQCSGHICRVLRPEKVVDLCTVIRDDGTVWQIYLSSFLSVTRLTVEKNQT